MNRRYDVPTKGWGEPCCHRRKHPILMSIWHLWRCQCNTTRIPIRQLSYPILWLRFTWILSNFHHKTMDTYYDWNVATYINSHILVHGCLVITASSSSSFSDWAPLLVLLSNVFRWSWTSHQHWWDQPHWVSTWHQQDRQIEFYLPRICHWKPWYMWLRYAQKWRVRRNGEMVTHDVSSTELCASLTNFLSVSSTRSQNSVVSPYVTRCQRYTPIQ